jgi:glycine cleavage system H protein
LNNWKEGGLVSPNNNYPADRKYHPEHTWAKAEGDVVVVGISYFAQEQLGEILFVELPGVGEELQEGRPFGVVESAKVASDLIAPVTGTVVAVNERLEEEPELVNEDPYGAGWMIRVKAAAGQLDALMEAGDYARDK